MSINHTSSELCNDIKICFLKNSITTLINFRSLLSNDFNLSVYWRQLIKLLDGFSNHLARPNNNFHSLQNKFYALQRKISCEWKFEEIKISFCREKILWNCRTTSQRLKAAVLAFLNLFITLMKNINIGSENECKNISAEENLIVNCENDLHFFTIFSREFRSTCVQCRKQHWSSFCWISQNFCDLNSNRNSRKSCWQTSNYSFLLEKNFFFCFFHFKSSLIFWEFRDLVKAYFVCHTQTFWISDKHLHLTLDKKFKFTFCFAHFLRALKTFASSIKNI